MNQRPLLMKYKGNRCRHCGITLKEMREECGVVKQMFEFNHIDPSKKHPNYKNMIERRTLSTELLDEVDKCVLLCVKCHKALTSLNHTVNLTVTATFHGKTISQTVRGQVILAPKLGTVSIFSDGMPLFYPYWVQLGSKRPKWMFGESLKEEFNNYLLNLKSIKSFRIYDGQRTTELFSAKVTGPDEYELQHHSRFWLIEVVGYDPNIWLRHGHIISDQGMMEKDGIFTLTGTVSGINERLRKSK